MPIKLEKIRQMAKVKNIIFDLGAVIININPDLTTKAMKNLGFNDFERSYSLFKQTDIFDKLEKGLIDEFETEHQLAGNLASMAEGNYFLARSMALKAGGNNENFIYFRDWMRLCFKKDVKGVSGWVDEISKIGRARQKDFLKYALHLLRQCALDNYGVEDLVTLKGDERVFMQKFAPYINHLNLEDYISLFNDARNHIDRNANAKILFTDISYRVLMYLKAAGQLIR